MKRIGLSLVVLLALAAQALALTQSSQPPQFTIPWGNSAGASFITYPTPTPSQIGITNCRASLTDGFPPTTFTPSSSGGCPPFGADFNGILHWVTLWNQWQGAGATVNYNATLSASIGGYPKNTILANATTPGCFWVSTVDNNTSNPDSAGTNWNGFCTAVGGTILAYLNVQDQLLTGGTNVTSLGLPTGTVTIDCGLRPLQYIANTGPFSIVAPANDGSCMLQIENGTGASAAIGFSGFTTNSNTGDAITATNGSKFVVSIWRIHGIASYLIKALQ